MPGLLIDECVNRQIVLPPFLSFAACTFVSEISRGSDDVDVMELARTSGLVLLTEDPDFGRLIFHEGRAPPPGVILVSLANRSVIERRTRIAAEAANAMAAATNALVVIDHDRLRRRPFWR